MKPKVSQLLQKVDAILSDGKEPKIVINIFICNSARRSRSTYQLRRTLRRHP